MLYLLGSIFCSTIILVLFKLFERYGVNNLYAIISNYLIAGALGYFFTPNAPSVSELLSSAWFLPAIAIGFLFIALFQVMATTAQKIGVSRVSIAVKMSVVLPVLAGLILYNENISPIGFVGIALALIAVILGTRKKGSKERTQESRLLLIVLPLVLFFGNGSIDVILKYAQHHWLNQDQMAVFSGALFSFAFIWGIPFALFERIKNKNTPAIKDFVWGLALGIPNFGSIYFLLEALDKSNMASAAIYPINNVAIVALSALSGVVLFSEKLSKINIIGLASAIIAICLIAYG